MSAIKCYEQACNNEIEISCSCASPPTFSCNKHLIQHCQSSTAPHNLTSLFLKPTEGTKEAMLNFLAEQKSKNDAIKAAIVTSFAQTIYSLEKIFEAALKEIDSDSINFDLYSNKLRETEKVSRLEKDPVLILLILQSHEAINQAKSIFMSNNNFESFKTMISLIEKVISSFNEEKLITIQSEELLKLENNKLNVEKEAKNTQQALNKYKEAIKVDPYNSDAYNSIGDILTEEKMHEEAIKYYEDAIRINPNYALYYLNKGYCLLELGRREEAMECFQNAIKIDPNEDKAYNNRGNILSVEEGHEEAIKYCEDAIRINPNDALYYANKGNYLLELDRTEEATGCIRKANMIDPNEGNSYDDIENFLREEKWHEESVNDINDAIKLKQLYARHFAKKGLALRLSGKIEEAIEHYKRAIEIDPNQAFTYKSIGDIFYHEKRYEEAIKYYNNAIRIDPNDALYYENKNLALRALEKRKEEDMCALW